MTAATSTYISNAIHFWCLCRLLGSESAAVQDAAQPCNALQQGCLLCPAQHAQQEPDVWQFEHSSRQQPNEEGIYSPDAQQQQHQCLGVTAQRAQREPDAVLFEHSSGQHATASSSYSPEAQQAQQQQQQQCMEGNLQSRGLTQHQPYPHCQRHALAHSEQDQAVVEAPALMLDCGRQTSQVSPPVAPLGPPHAQGGGSWAGQTQGGWEQGCNRGPCRQALPLALPKQQPSDMYHDAPLPASASVGAYQQCARTPAAQQRLHSVIQPGENFNLWLGVRYRLAYFAPSEGNCLHCCQLAA